MEYSVLHHFTNYRSLFSKMSISAVNKIKIFRRVMSSTIARETPTDGNNNFIVPKNEVVRFISDCMHKAGATVQDAQTVADHLMTADYRGHFSHGMNRVSMYVNDIEEKLTDPHAKPQILTDFQVNYKHINFIICLTLINNLLIYVFAAL